MTEEKNITHNDMRFLQNDLLNDMKKLELQLNGKVASINQILLTKMGDYDSKFTKIFDNITELISQMAERKYDNDRVEELLKMRNKFSDQIIENQSRITIIDKSLEKALFRYDKIILDNLSVPGLIGVGSKFKNCASFFKYVDNEMQINQKFKEEGSTNLKTLTEKVETRLKKAEGDITQILQNVNHICDVKFEKIFHKIEERAVSQENMIAQTRIENSRHTTELIKASTELKIQWEKLENIKNEIYARYDEEMEKFKKLVLVTDRNYKKQEVEFNVFKQRFSQLAEYLKDFKNSTKNYKEMAKDINFNKKQKLKDDFDLGKYDEIGENVRDYIKSPFPNRKKNELDVDSQEDKKDDNISEKNVNRKNFKRSSLSPSPRKTAIFRKKKKMTELEKINKIAKEGNKRLSNVFTFKNKLKEINDGNSNNIVKKNLNYFYKTDLKRKSDLTAADLNKEKKNLKTLKRKKTIVTENNIDLNFDTNKEEDKELSKEESENSSFSSNFSLSSIISLKKIGDESKEEEKKKEIKEQDKEENIELYSDKEVKNSEGENTYKSKKTQTEKRSEENQTSTFREKNKEISEKIIQKNLGRDMNNKKIENKKNEINSIKKENINNKKGNNSGINKTPTNSKEITKKKKEQETQNKSKNKIKPIEKQLKINISKEKSSKTNQIIDKKGTSRNIDKKVFAFEKDNIKQDNKTTTKNNLITLNNEIKKEASIDKINQAKTISVFNKQIKQAMTEYTNKKSNPITKAVSNRINTEVTFPQIKLKSNEIYKAQNSQPQIIKLMSNTPKENRKIKNKLILDNNNINNIKPNFYKALISNQRLNTNNNYENKDTLSVSLEKKEEKENNEINDVNSLEKEKEKEEKSDEVKEKEENNNVTETNNGNEQEQKSNINIKGLFNSLYDEIKEIKEITTNNNANKEKDIINNKNAFLTSLNQVNNNYNYYYNDSNENQVIPIPITNPQTKKEIDDETIKRFNNEIDFINGNIKLVNHRISTLENRYQLILNQLNNIFNTVSSYYHHHKRKMEQHASMRMNNKKGINRGRSIDYQKEEDILSDKKFMLKLKDMYNDDYENNEELRLKIPNDEYNKTLRKIEPFLIKKFKNG